MLVTGLFQPGSLVKPVSESVEDARSRARQLPDNQERPIDTQPHFTMISTITPGSFAGAYQTLRGASPVAPLAEAVILSGVGVPSAIAAYGEVIDTD